MLVLFELIIKKVLNDLVIYCKTQGRQKDQNDWKNEQNTNNIVLYGKIIESKTT